MNIELQWGIYLMSPYLHSPMNVHRGRQRVKKIHVRTLRRVGS